MQVFISYAREDKDIADNIYSELMKHDIKPWIDTHCLLPGAPWKHAINQAILGSRYFIALLSSSSVSKVGYVQRELKEALEVLDNYPEGGIFVIPVRLDDCKPTHPRLFDLNWVDLFPDFNKGFTRIMRVLKPGVELSHAFSQAEETTGNSIEYILSIHPQNMQLPQGKLKDAISLLYPGKYYLITTDKRPKNGKTLRRIMYKMQMNTWKRMKWKIISEHDLVQYIEFDPFIRMYGFVVRE